MKTHRIISFTLFNAFILLGFASMLAGCQKKLYPSHGHLSKSHKITGRSIASIEETSGSQDQAIGHSKKFYSFQDPTQIYIYCSLNAKEANNCYSEQLQASVSKFQEKFGKIGKEDLNQLLDELKWESIKSTTESRVQGIIQELTPEINKTVNKQHQFCKQNSRHFFKRCMKQGVDKDTFQVLNKFHKKNKMNGQEYLFLKDAITHQLNHKVENLNVI